MKREVKNMRKQLRLASETIRGLDVSKLEDVVGGVTQSNNGCGSSGSLHPTLCLACQV